MAPDLASLLKPRDIPYETQERDGIEVGYSLMFTNDVNMEGYRLTLVFRNKGSQEKNIKPIVNLEDESRIQLPAYSYEAFVSNGAVLARTQTPPMPASQQSNYYSTGTIRNVATGSSYSYTGTTAPTPYGAAGGFAAGLAQGMAQGAANRARQDREDGLMMMKWANAFWLKSSYSLQPGAGAVGVLFFPSPKVGNLPLRLMVTVGGQDFVFVTKAAS